MRTRDEGTGQVGWVHLHGSGLEGTGAVGGSRTSRATGGVAALASARWDDAQVRALSWEGDRLLLWLLVPGATGAVTPVTIVYHGASVSGGPIAEAVRCTLLSQRVEPGEDGAGRHRIWLWPDSEVVIAFTEVEVRQV